MHINIQFLIKNLLLIHISYIILAQLSLIGTPFCSCNKTLLIELAFI